MKLRMSGKFLLVPLLLGLLLSSGGCMLFMHHDHGGDGKEAVVSQGPGDEQAAGMAKAERPAPAAGNALMSGMMAHHGGYLFTDGSPWAWFVGGGMVLMMALMLL